MNDKHKIIMCSSNQISTKEPTLPGLLTSTLDNASNHPKQKQSNPSRETKISIINKSILSYYRVQKLQASLSADAKSSRLTKYQHGNV